MNAGKTVIDCPHLPDVDAPIEWAVRSGDTLYTSQIPIRADGSIETGDIGEQATLVFDNLGKTLDAAGGSLSDVCQVQIFITHPEDFQVINRIYGDCFSPPYPNRATVQVAGLLAAGIRIEIVAHARIDA